LGEQLALEGVKLINMDDFDSYDAMRARGNVPIVDDNGEILMWVPQLFFDMTYEEFNAFVEELATLVMFQTQEPIDFNILREHWLAAQ